MSTPTLSDLRDAPIEEMARQFHVHDPSIAADPWPVLDRLATQCPVARSEALGGFYFVSRMDDIRTVLRDPVTFSSTANAVPWPEGDTLQSHPINFDPPEHTMFRAAMGTMTSPTSVKSFEERAHSLASRYAVDLVAAGPIVEFISTFAVPFPAGMMLKILGLPESDLELLLRYRDEMLQDQFSPDPEVVRHFIDVSRPEMYAYVAEQVERHKRAPAAEETVIGSLQSARLPDGRALTDDEIVRTVALLIGAGLDTVSSTLGWMAIYFADHQDRWQELIDHPERIQGAVEELLRITSIVTLGRKVTREVELGGMRLHPGEMVVLSLPSAGRDGHAFPDPLRIDFQRKPNAHMAFGGGPHRCWGSHLARMELRIALEELTKAIPRFSIAPGTKPDTDYGLIMNVNELHLQLDSGNT
jgi:cytochrome P450